MTDISGTTLTSPSSQPAPSLEKVDVAVNIFAKPFQTALSLLSLWKQSSRHIGEIWLQFEPVGSKHDYISTYHIAKYLTSEVGAICHIFQPGSWVGRKAAEKSNLTDCAYRLNFRYQHAFENSQSRLMFVMHNDVFIFNDIIGALKNNMGDAFAIGQLGQCWNCPAFNKKIMNDVMGCGPCNPLKYAKIRPTLEELCAIYKKARELGVFARPYDKNGFDGEFAKQPWPLPECRVNEWACLVDLGKTKEYAAPFGNGWPFGAFRSYAGENLDTAVAWFRDMHARGLIARHFDISKYLKHWVGTGKKRPNKYAQAEDNALLLLKKYFPEYIIWLSGECDRKF